MERIGLNRIVSLDECRKAEARGEIVRRHYSVGRMQQLVPNPDQFAWTALTLLVHGGLFVDVEGFVIARPATPCLDVNTEGLIETYESKLPQRECTYTAIVDGVGAVVVKNQITGIPLVVTNRGFYDPISQWATGWFMKKLLPLRWPEGYTPNVCIQAPMDRRLVQTDKRELTLTALVNIATGEEMPLADLARIAYQNELPCIQTLDECMDDAQIVAKGFVQTFPVKGGGPLKVRTLKEGYMHNMKHIRRASIHMLWKACRAGLTYYDRVKEDQSLPLGYKEFIQRHLDLFRARYAVIRKNAEQAFEQMPFDIPTEERRQWLYDNCPEFAHVLSLKLEDEKGYTEALWDTVQPPLQMGKISYLTP
jgi:hypothetical protein